MADQAALIDKFLSGRASPLAGLGNVFVAAGQKYGVDPLLPVAISGAESGFGQHTLGAHNAWGWGPGKSFGSWEDAISTITQGLRSGYLNEGRNTVASIGQKWAPEGASNDPGGLNSNWVQNVSGFLRDLGGDPGVSSRRSVTATAAAAPAPAVRTLASAVPRAQPLKMPSFDDVIMRNVGLDPTVQVRNLVDAMIANEGRPSLPASGGPRAASPVPTVPPVSKPFVPLSGMGKVTISPNANRAGVAIHPAVVDFVRQIAGTYGRALEIGTGTNHNQFVVGTHRQSRHWTGDAADIPASGAALTNLGRAALITAGMDPKVARRQTGGLFNINGKQIIFNSMIGGNHYNHLHVGL